jgi:hypothetical protein
LVTTGKELLYFLYTGHVRPSANAQELLAAGAMYEIQELVHYSVQVPSEAYNFAFMPPTTFLEMMVS